MEKFPLTPVAIIAAKSGATKHLPLGLNANSDHIFRFYLSPKKSDDVFFSSHFTMRYYFLLLYLIKTSTKYIAVSGCTATNVQEVLIFL